MSGAGRLSGIPGHGITATFPSTTSTSTTVERELELELISSNSPRSDHQTTQRITNNFIMQLHTYYVNSAFYPSGLVDRVPALSESAYLRGANSPAENFNILYLFNIYYIKG